VLTGIVDVVIDGDGVGDGLSAEKGYSPRTLSPFSTRSRFSEHENALTQALSRARAAGTRILSVAESNPTAVGLSPDVASFLAPEGVSHYEPEPFGHLTARRAIAADLHARGFAIAPEQVMCTASTSEAYGFLFKLLCDPGDRVLVPAPSYPLFDTLAQLEGVTLVPYRLAYDGAWHLDASELAQDAKAVIVVHPNNPTGHFLKRAELAQLAALGIPIVSDEVFADYALHDDAQRATSALEAADRTLVFRLGGLSKAVALPQLKLAWTAIAGPGASEAVRRLQHIADAYLSPATPVQLALPQLLALAPAVQAAIRARCAANLATLARALGKDSAATLLQVEGGWYAIVRLPAVMDEDAWVLTLLEQDGLFVQPGYYYELGRGAFAVLSLITPEADFARGAALLAARVNEQTSPL
jgi:alanine-synthesizing transaminase